MPRYVIRCDLGSFRCEGVTVDGRDMWTERSLADAVRSLIDFARTMNDSAITVEDITFLRSTEGGEWEEFVPGQLWLHPAEWQNPEAG